MKNSFEDEEISVVEVEEMSIDTTEMSIESLLELINKNVEEGLDVSKLDRKMSMRAKFIDMVEEFEHGGEMMNSVQKYELLMKVWSEAARWETFNGIMRRILLEGEMPDFDVLKNKLEIDMSLGAMVGRSAD